MKNQKMTVKDGDILMVVDGQIVPMATTAIDAQEEKPMIRPAEIRRPFLATPDNKIMSFPSPGWLYQNIVSERVSRKAVKWSDYETFRDTMNTILVSTIKECIITSFNLINNPFLPATDSNIIQHTVGCSGLIDITNSDPSRHAQELFTTRETLEKILNILPGDKYGGLYLNAYDVFKDEDSTADTVYRVLTLVYNVCLNYVDCEKDKIGRAHV